MYQTDQLHGMVFYLFVFLVSSPRTRSDGFRPITPEEQIPGLLIMLCWPRGALGCAQGEGFVMPDAVCKLAQWTVFLFAVPQWNWLVDIITNDGLFFFFPPRVFLVGVTGVLVAPSVFLLFLSPPSWKMTSMGTYILTFGLKYMVQRGAIWMVKPSSLEHLWSLRGWAQLLCAPLTSTEPLHRTHASRLSLASVISHSWCLLLHTPFPSI